MRDETFVKQAPRILCSSAGIERSRAEGNRCYRSVWQCAQDIAPMLGVLKVAGQRGEFDQAADGEPVGLIYPIDFQKTCACLNVLLAVQIA
jgi:hypothetical protein